MKIQDVKQGTRIILELESTRKDAGGRLRGNMPVRLVQEGERILVMPLEDGVVPVETEPANKRTGDQLRRLLARNLPNLSVVIDVTDGRVTVEVRTFAEEKPMDLSIGIEDELMDKAMKRANLDNIRNPEASLAAAFILDQNGMKLAVMGIHVQADQKDRFEHFILAGKEGFLRVGRRTDEEGDRYFVAESITAKINEQDYTFILLKGSIAFKNATFMEKARHTTLAAMNELAGNIEGYLNTWEKYGMIEQEESLDKAKQAGILRFSGWEQAGNRICLFLNEREALAKFCEYVGSDDHITLCGKPPHELFAGRLDAFTYKEFRRANKDNVNARIAAVIIPDEQRIYINLPDDKNLPGDGYLFLSLDGDLERFKRRAEARDNILKGNNYMPHLAAIMEGRTIAKPVKQRIAPISPAVKADIFPTNDPTPIQTEAIDIAINTPDIALIQGPPGTGKTTVIMAILKRLNEITDSSEGLFGRNLITAYQHDAVQNAVERVEILGLPAVKIGNNRKNSADDIQVMERLVENWIEDRKDNLRERYPQLVKENYLAEFDDIYNSYLYSANTIANTIRLLETAKELLLERLPEALLEELNRSLTTLKLATSGSHDPEREHLLGSIYRIPYTPAAYEDNGKMALREAIFRLERESSEELREYAGLFQPYTVATFIDEAGFQALRRVRSKLLVMLIPEEEIFHQPKQKEEIRILFGRISDVMRSQFYQTHAGENAALMDYISEYENSPLSIRDTIMDYVSVLGATNQQVMGKAINKYKGERTFYDNVLVDEAARSNPLDLFIPLALAKDRIILVGDHRQLPHIVDDKVKKELEKKYAGEEDETVIEKMNANIKDSMFQHLFRVLKQLEKKDGIKRTITLNKQYRTHRVLGEFVSRNFYEKHDDGSIDSPLPDELFAHRLPGLENKACVWYDVPISEGTETDRMSKTRPAEAKKIALHLKSLMDSGAGADMSFGIITFYSDQVEEIYKELVNVGIASRSDTGKYKIADKYREGSVKGKRIEKLRIGTVDAFQGMEFDVVYLSMVRSNRLPDRTALQKRKKYGHLMVENRLCVSMSRQKKMLIAVGDSNMLRSPGAESAIPALINYYSLCRGEEQYGQIL